MYQSGFTIKKSRKQIIFIIMGQQSIGNMYEINIKIKVKIIIIFFT